MSLMKTEETKRLVAKSENSAVEFKRARGGVPADCYCLVSEGGKWIVKKAGR